MADESYHYCEVDVRPSMAENPRHEVEGQVIFELKFQVTKVRRKSTDFYNEGELHLQVTSPDEYDPTVEKVIKVRKNVLLRDNSAYRRDDNGVLTNYVSILSIILSSHAVPINHQDHIIFEIHNMAKSMVRNPSYAGQTVLPMTVQVSVVTHMRTVRRAIAVRSEDDFNADAAMRASLENDQPTENSYRATASSIEALDRVTIIEGVKYLELIGDCPICMDKFLIGTEVRRMPCLHIFHGKCITEWLERSHLCPLCRFAMPCQLQRI